MRHIKFASPSDLERPFVRRYIRASIEQLDESAASTGGTGKIVVKSVREKHSVTKRPVKRSRARV
jgi:hypothetical protein